MNNDSSNTFIRAGIDVLSFSSYLEHFMSMVLKPYDLTLQQFNALRILAKHYPEPITLKKLTNQMVDKSSNTSRLIDKLANKNLAIRQMTPDDHRIVHLLMTEEGGILINKVSIKLDLSLQTHFILENAHETNAFMQNFKLLTIGC